MQDLKSNEAWDTQTESIKIKTGTTIVTFTAETLNTYLNSLKQRLRIRKIGEKIEKGT